MEDQEFEHRCWWLRMPWILAYISHRDVESSFSLLMESVLWLLSTNGMWQKSYCISPKAKLCLGASVKSLGKLTLGEASHHVKSLTLLRVPCFKNPKSPREILVNEMSCEETAGPQSSTTPDLRAKKHPCKWIFEPKPPNWCHLRIRPLSPCQVFSNSWPVKIKWLLWTAKFWDKLSNSNTKLEEPERAKVTMLSLALFKMCIKCCWCL